MLVEGYDSLLCSKSWRKLKFLFEPALALHLLFHVARSLDISHFLWVISSPCSLILKVSVTRSTSMPAAETVCTLRSWCSVLHCKSLRQLNELLLIWCQWNLLQCFFLQRQEKSCCWYSIFISRLSDANSKTEEQLCINSLMDAHYWQPGEVLDLFLIFNTFRCV